MKINLQFNITIKKILVVLTLIILFFIVFLCVLNKNLLFNFNNNFKKNNKEISNELSSDEIKEISKSLVLLECPYDENDDGRWESHAYGSGTYLPAGVINYNYKELESGLFENYILTNAHVTQLKRKTISGQEFNYCHAINNGQNLLFNYDIDSIRYQNNNDFSLLYHLDDKPNQLAGSNPYNNSDFKTLAINQCNVKNLIGEKVYIFGYPSSAFEYYSKDEIRQYNEKQIEQWEKSKNSEEKKQLCEKYKNTLWWSFLNCDQPFLRDLNDLWVKNQNLVITDGIISGKMSDSENYYTSAKIDAGNSGGLAVSKINGKICIVGVPTWVSQGEYSNLGVIQGWNKVKIEYSNFYKKKSDVITNQTTELKEDEKIINDKKIDEVEEDKCFDYKKSVLGKYNYDMQEIFYSPSLNSCIFAYWYYTETDERSVPRHMIKNLSNNKIIFDKTDSEAWASTLKDLR